MESRQNALLETNNLIELTVAEKDVAAIREVYSNYLKKLKETNEYKQLIHPEKAQFDAKYKATEEIRNGQKIIVLRFKNQEDATQFIKQLEQQGIKCSVQKVVDKPNAEPSNSEEYRSPSPGRR